ncbi:MAG: hypothetical protein Q8P16_02385, partial [bacterium]|nr:hypothetical protein [bacterium]
MNSRVLPILALMLSIGIFFAYVNPTWNGPIAETKAAIAADVDALTAADIYTKQQAELARQQEAIDPANLARLSVFLPDSVDNVGLILDLNTLAARSGVSLSNVDVAAKSGSADANVGGALPISETSPIDSVDLSLSAVGTYVAFQTFLSGI